MLTEDQQAGFNDLKLIHEAGHAVMAAHVRLPFEYVTVVEDKEIAASGHLKITEARYRTHWRVGGRFIGLSEQQFRQAYKPYFEKHIMVAFGGLIAQRLYAGSYEGDEELASQD